MRALIRWIWRWIWRLAGFAVGAGLVAGALAYYLTSRSLPDYSADYQVAGITAPVRILRDARAIPHIFGKTDADVYFGLGFAQAQDRLWQMEIARRSVQGRLAELLGARALPLDRAMRTLDLYTYARAAVAKQTPETIAALKAYAAGVNAWIRVVDRKALGRGAPEFFVFSDSLMSHQIDPWTPADSIAILKGIALRLTHAAAIEAQRARFALRLSPKQINDLLPDSPGGTHTALPSYTGLFPGQSFPPPPAAAAAAADFDVSGLFTPPRLRGASNAWAVTGARSATGAPLLASDPHLWLSAPSIWMLARLEFPDGGVIGAALPGTPLVLLGRNRHIAWGLTTANVDDQDIYIERLNPKNHNQYLTPDGWRNFITRKATIRSADGAEETITLRWTRHGPVIKPEQFGFGQIVPQGHVAALRWTDLTDEDRSIEAGLKLMRARTTDEAVAAARLHLAPAQNLIVADKNGVAMTIAGKVPLRRTSSRTQGRLPTPGWEAENDWIGFLSRADMPNIANPPNGMTANANNRTTTRAFPYNITYNWGAPYRINRIRKQLNARRFHSLSSFEALQNDSVSEMARSILPLIANDLWWRRDAHEGGAGAKRRIKVLDMLADWNGEMSEHQVEPLIFTAWVRALSKRLAGDELGKMMDAYKGLRPLFIERVYRNIDGAGRWCDVQRSPVVETCAEMAKLALDDALDELTADYGPQIETWRWGVAHRATQMHMPLGLSGPLGYLLNIEQETSGGDYTVNRAAIAGVGDHPYADVQAASYRAVYDFADLDRSVYIISTGESGHFLSRHYDDLSQLWRDGEYIPMSLNVEDATAGSVGETILRPGG